MASLGHNSVGSVLCHRALPCHETIPQDVSERNPLRELKTSLSLSTTDARLPTSPLTALCPQILKLASEKRLALMFASRCLSLGDDGTTDAGA